jgi:hypothetical protein
VFRPSQRGHWSAEDELTPGAVAVDDREPRFLQRNLCEANTGTDRKAQHDERNGTARHAAARCNEFLDRIEQHAPEESAHGSTDQAVADLGKRLLLHSLNNADPDAHEHPTEAARQPHSVGEVAHQATDCSPDCSSDQAWKSAAGDGLQARIAQPRGNIYGTSNRSARNRRRKQDLDHRKPSQDRRFSDQPCGKSSPACENRAVINQSTERHENEPSLARPPVKK